MAINKRFVFTATTCIALAAIVVASCKENKPPVDPPPTEEAACMITPQAFPDSKITGINFPEDSNTIYKWLADQDNDAIADHAWGIWAGLTWATTQDCGGDKLPVYETWYSSNELQRFMKDGTPFDPAAKKKGRVQLSRPSQHHHAALLAGTADPSNPVSDTTNLWVTVAYSPGAAQFAMQNQIYSQTSLKKYGAGPNAIGSIPPFPSDAITTKPTYLLAPKPGTDLIEFPVWPGTPEVGRNIGSFKPYWKFVMVDPTNANPANTLPTPITAAALSNPDSVKAATVNLDQFIHFRMDAELAARFQAEFGVSANKGDIAILAGMHVATKEIANWTWQTFFWAPDPDQPPTPSSSQVARVRRSHSLSTAAAHYAAVPVYAMVYPNQPITGGTNTGVTPIIGYNPYLEPNLGILTPPNGTNALNPKFLWGVQSNCMTCHSLATLKPDSIQTVIFNGDTSSISLNYSADQYISMNDAFFQGWTQLDFAWSINAMAFVPKNTQAKEAQKK